MRWQFRKMYALFSAHHRMVFGGAAGFFEI